MDESEVTHSALKAASSTMIKEVDVAFDKALVDHQKAVVTSCGNIDTFDRIKADLADVVEFRQDCVLLKEGILTKCSGDKSDSYYFILTNHDFIYCKQSSTSILSTIMMFGGSAKSSHQLIHHLTIPLTQMVVKKVSSILNCFVIRSKIKSFYVAASNSTEANAWFDLISATLSYVICL